MLVQDSSHALSYCRLTFLEGDLITSLDCDQRLVLSLPRCFELPPTIYHAGDERCLPTVP